MPGEFENGMALGLICAGVADIIGGQIGAGHIGAGLLFLVIFWVWRKL